MMTEPFTPAPSLVSGPMYMGSQTSPLTAISGLDATKESQTHKTCLWCGKPLLSPRRNQSYCNADCRHAHDEQKRHRNVAPKTDTCPHCGAEFEKVPKTKVFCTTTCQQEFNNHWKAQGPRLALAMQKWRVEKKPGAFTDMCREFSQSRQLLQDKRTNAHKAKGNAMAGKKGKRFGG